jgi:hypothetical protein
VNAFKKFLGWVLFLLDPMQARGLSPLLETREGKKARSASLAKGHLADVTDDEPLP